MLCSSPRHLGACHRRYDRSKESSAMKKYEQLKLAKDGLAVLPDMLRYAAE
jgi:hypothetical protein